MSVSPCLEGSPGLTHLPVARHGVWHTVSAEPMRGVGGSESRPDGFFPSRFVCSPVRGARTGGCKLRGAAGFPRQPASLSEGVSHWQFWGPQLLPYVGCLCLRDPSHINVIIRASIYADFLRSGSSGSCGSGLSSLHRWFRDIIPFYIRGQIGRGREGQRNVAETGRYKTQRPPRKWALAPWSQPIPALGS